MFRSWIEKAFQIIIICLLCTQISVTQVLAQELPSVNSNNSSPANIENVNPQKSTSTTSVMEDMRKVTSDKKSQVTPRVKSPRTNSSRPNDPYEKYYEGIKKFNDELYGERG